MNRRLLLTLAAVVGLSASPALARSPSLQFDLFVRVCAAHAGDYDGAIQALRAEGFQPGQSRAETSGGDSRSAAFTKTVDGVHYDVMVIWISDWFDAGQPGTLCAVHRNPADPDALAQARAWAGAPKYKQLDRQEFFLFRQRAGENGPQASSDPDDRDTRRMLIESDGASTTLSLITR